VDQGPAWAETERGGVPRRRGAAPTGEGAAARDTGCRDTPTSSGRRGRASWWRQVAGW